MTIEDIQKILNRRPQGLGTTHGDMCQIELLAAIFEKLDEISRLLAERKA